MSKAYINGEVPRASSRAMFREMEEEEGTRVAAAVVAASLADAVEVSEGSPVVVGASFRRGDGRGRVGVTLAMPSGRAVKK